jgi:hypothetical protein
MVSNGTTAHVTTGLSIVTLNIRIENVSLSITIFSFTALDNVMASVIYADC